MENSPNTQTVSQEKSSNGVPWKLISILLFILIMYTVSLFFWTWGKKQDDTQEPTREKNWTQTDVFSEDEDVEDEDSQSSEAVSEDTEESAPSGNLEQKVTGKYKKFQSFLLDTSWQENMKNKAFSNIWWEENIFPIWEKSVKVTYPKGSYKPSASPRGGAGFIYNLGANYEEISLSYEIEFADNFEFVKWGKLPGLCGGSCPRGTEKGEGISVNLWWNKEENLEISIMWSEGKVLLDEALSKVEAWEKYTINLWVKMNTPWASDGSIIIDINGENILEENTMILRNKKEVVVDSLFFSTFFGGSDASWATPVDTSIVFSNFKIYATRKQ